MSIRTTFVMVMFLSVIAGYFLLADFRGVGSSEPSAPWFYTVNMEDIRKITFTTSDGSIGFFQSQEAGGETWRFDNEFAMPVDLARWSGITLLLSGPQSRRALLRELEDPKRFGLDTPILTVDVQLTGERSVHVELGDKTPDGLSYYIVQQDNPGLYLIDSSWGDVLSKITLNPPYPTWYYKIDPTKVLYMDVKSGGAENSFLKERFIGEPDRWRLSGQDGAAMDMKVWNERIAPLLGGPKDLKLVKKSVNDPKEFGLDAPAGFIRVEYEPPFEPQQDDPEPELRRVLELQVGAATPDGQAYYAKPKDQDYVFSISKSWWDTMATLAGSPPLAQSPSATSGS
jgi:hypothetical protein